MSPHLKSNIFIFYLDTIHKHLEHQIFHNMSSLICILFHVQINIKWISNNKFHTYQNLPCIYYLQPHVNLTETHHI